jgi:hypothetical protein
MSNAKTTDDLVAEIAPLLADERPEVIGSALVELIAIFLAAHAPEQREQLGALLIDAAHRLIDEDRFSIKRRDDTARKRSH